MFLGEKVIMRRVAPFYLTSITFPHAVSKTSFNSVLPALGGQLFTPFLLFSLPFFSYSAPCPLQSSFLFFFFLFPNAPSPGLLFDCTLEA